MALKIEPPSPKKRLVTDELDTERLVTEPVACRAVAEIVVPPLQIEDGTLLWIDHYGEHPAIVIRHTNQGLIQVAHGTSQEHIEILQRQTVEPTSRAGKALALNRTTYFFPNSWCFLRSETQIVRRCGRNPDLLLAIRRLTGG